MNRPNSDRPASMPPTEPGSPSSSSSNAGSSRSHSPPRREERSVPVSRAWPPMPQNVAWCLLPVCCMWLPVPGAGMQWRPVPLQYRPAFCVVPVVYITAARQPTFEAPSPPVENFQEPPRRRRRELLAEELSRPACEACRRSRGL